MRERVVDLVGGAGRAMWVSTFHSMCVRILRAQSGLLGETLNSNFSIYDADDSRRLLDDHPRSGTRPQEVLGAGLAVAISNFKNELVAPDQVRSQRGQPMAMPRP